MDNNKKRHHSTPRAYLKYFCDDTGMLSVYRKDNPTKVLRRSPKSIAFQEYYYSQPHPDGGYDHNTLEDFFSEYESKWPPIVERLRRKENVNDNLEDICAFIELQRARVPASRDACEAMRAETVKVTMRRMETAGELPPLPKGLESDEQIEISINPHRSIHDMLHIIKDAGKILYKIGIGVFHNTTGIPFLTSDNPVIWFDPSVPETDMQPYALCDDGPVVLLFPVTPDLLIYGHTSMRGQFAKRRVVYSELSGSEAVETMNQQICRFAYRAVFAQQPGYEEMILKYADASPVFNPQEFSAEIGEFVIPPYMWGKIKDKPKWEKIDITKKKDNPQSPQANQPQNNP